MVISEQQVEISRFTLFPGIEGSLAVAGLTLVYGALCINAKLCRERNRPDRFFLAMPSRKGTNRQGEEEYFKEVWFRDQRLLDAPLAEAIRLYEQSAPPFSNN